MTAPASCEARSRACHYCSRSVGSPSAALFVRTFRSGGRFQCMPTTAEAAKNTVRQGKRHIADQCLRIERLRKLIARLERHSQFHLVPDAVRHLAQMERALAQTEADLHSSPVEAALRNPIRCRELYQLKRRVAQGVPKDTPRINLKPVFAISADLRVIEQVRAAVQKVSMPADEGVKTMASLEAFKRGDEVLSKFPNGSIMTVLAVEGLKVRCADIHNTQYWFDTIMLERYQHSPRTVEPSVAEPTCNYGLELKAA